MKISIFSLLVLLSIQTSYAEIAGKVKIAQFPSWIDRDGEVIALRPGQEIEEGDNVYTGKGGKLLLSMNDGSDVKLGNNSELVIKKVENAKPQNDNVFGMALNVLKGVFRFTTSAVSKRKKRDVAISFGTVTAGIRGTDIWGRSNNEQDLVCLLEGKIEVTHPLSSPVIMDEALEYYDAKPNSPGALKGKVDSEQVALWAKLTEVDDTQGLMQEGGEWTVVLMSLNNIAHANEFVKQLNSRGYPAQIQMTEINEKKYYRVIISDFMSANDARHAQKRLNNLNGVQNAWVKKYSF